MKESNPLASLLGLCLLPIILAIIIVLIAIAIPVLGVLFIKEKIDDSTYRKAISKAKQLNEGKLYFFYKDYRTYNFITPIQEEFKHIVCINIDAYPTNDILATHILQEYSTSRFFPRLVKIQNANFIHKEHNNAFKYYVKRKKDIDSFLKLIKSSIVNLERKQEK